MNNSTVNLNITQASMYWTTFTICLSSINILFGLPTHICVIWLIIRGPETGLASEFFNLNLSVCEIGICLDSVLELLSMWFSNIIQSFFFLQGLLVVGRPLFQCLICVERYLAVVHPVTFLKYKPLRYKVMCSVAAWIICLGSCLTCLFLLVTVPYMALNIFIFSIQSSLFLSIQLFCCVAVLRALKQSGPGERGREREEENHMKRRAFHIILITTVGMILTYIPFTVTGLYSIMTEHYVDDPVLISFVFFVFAGFVQPFVYLHRSGKLTCFCSQRQG